MKFFEFCAEILVTKFTRVEVRLPDGSCNWTLSNCGTNSRTRRFFIKILKIKIFVFDHKRASDDKNLLSIVLGVVYLADLPSFITLGCVPY